MPTPFDPPLRALIRYLGWYLRAAAALPAGQRGLRLRRAAFLLVFPLFLAVQLVHWIFLLLDELLFPQYRRQPVRQPVFILGVPRSGTTFLHRQLASDAALGTPTTWEVVFAPSICQRRLIHLLSALDRRLGGPVARLLGRALMHGQGSFASIHSVELAAAEEDYLALLPLGACFLLLMAFPTERALLRLGAFRDMPQAQREALLDSYHALLQRHCYCHPGRRLLSKNAAFAEWPQALLSRYPDACFILCVRPPEAALASQLASLESARFLFALDSDGTQTRYTFTHLFARFFANLREFQRSCPPPQLAVVAQPRLRRHTAQVVQQLSAQLGLQPALPEPGAGGSDGLPAHRYPQLPLPLRSSCLLEEMRSDYRDLLAAATA